MAISYFLLLSCVGLFTGAQAQNCSKPVPGENMDLRGNDILLESFPSGTTVRFSCNIGYRPTAGKISITCTEGIWSPLTLQCGKKSCGSAGEVLNGDVNYIPGNEFGDRATVTCKPGFRVVGKNELRCGDKGWEGRLPRCEVVTCDPPPTIVDGSYDPDEDAYNYRAAVEYTCNPGLDLIGSRTISCSAEGQFSPAPPECKKVECPDFAIENGNWAGGSRPPHGYQATMTFKCNAGYKIKAHDTVKCGSDNRWSLEPPQCEEVTCERPPEVDHGSFNPNQTIYRYNDQIKYSCDAGYRLTSTSSLTCSQSGTFPSPPTCTMVTCERPPDVDHGSFSPFKNTYQYNEVVKYSCDAGYDMTGNDSRSCSQSGTFTSAPPTCTRKVTTPRPTTATTATTATTTTTTTSTTTLNTPKTKENSGNSVGIGIGVFLGVLFVAGCGFYFYKRSSEKRRVGEKVTDGEDGVILSERKNGADAEGTDVKT